MGVERRTRDVAGRSDLHRSVQGNLLTATSKLSSVYYLEGPHSKVMFPNTLLLESSQVRPLALLGIYQLLCLRSSGLVTVPCNVTLLVYTAMNSSLTETPGGVGWVGPLCLIGLTNSMSLTGQYWFSSSQGSCLGEDNILVSFGPHSFSVE